MKRGGEAYAFLAALQAMSEIERFIRTNVAKMSLFKWSCRREKAAIALARGYTQEEAAIEASVTRRTIVRWLRHPEFKTEVDRLSLMVDVANRAERLRITMRVIRDKIEGEKIETSRDLLDWLKYAQGETDGIKLELTSLLANAIEPVADSGSDRAPQLGEEEVAEQDGAGSTGPPAPSEL